MPNFLLGADPELFVVDGEGKFISSIGKFGGTKENPIPIGEGCAIQEDNVAVEFNIPPSDSEDAFVAGLSFALSEIEKKAKFHNLRLAIVPSARFEQDQLADRAARVFGCEPDYNAWTGRVNPRPRAKDKALRSSGGHVHFGWTREKQYSPTIMVRGCDVIIGTALAQADPDERRRLLYGKAGAFRNKPQYPGFEYRTPSNWWIGSEERMRWMYQQMTRVVTFLDEHPTHTFEEDAALVDECINKNNKEAFSVLNNKYDLEVPC